MPNKNYLRGRRKEYKLKHQLEKAGYIVLRTAGSHGFADLISIDKVRKSIVFIQVKPDTMSEKQKEKLDKEHSWLQDEFEVWFEVR